MKLLTYWYEEREQCGVLSADGERVLPMEYFGLPYTDMNEIVCSLSDAEMARIYEKLALDEGEGLPLRAVKLLAPIPRPKQDVFCLGWNYADHVKEGERFRMTEYREKNIPVLFAKRVSRAVDPDAVIERHADLTEQLDYEAELAVVLRKSVRYLQEGEVRDAIFGYMILNDVTARDQQTAHKQWYFGKSLDGFTPMGPWIVTADEFEEFPPQLQITCRVNGELRQNGNTDQQVFSLEYILPEITKGMTLEAGTIFSSGTPAGVGMGMTPPCFLRSGDVIEIEIEKIGKIRNTVGE